MKNSVIVRSTDILWIKENATVKEVHEVIQQTKKVDAKILAKASFGFGVKSIKA